MIQEPIFVEDDQEKVFNYILDQAGKSYKPVVFFKDIGDATEMYDLFVEKYEQGAGQCYLFDPEA